MQLLHVVAASMHWRIVQKLVFSMMPAQKVQQTRAEMKLGCSYL